MIAADVSRDARNYKKIIVFRTGAAGHWWFEHKTEGNTALRIVGKRIVSNCEISYVSRCQPFTGNVCRRHRRVFIVKQFYHYNSKLYS